MLTPALEEYLDTYAFWAQHGTLPEAGGLNDQPATWIDATIIMDHAIARDRAEKQEREREAARRAAAKK